MATYKKESHIRSLLKGISWRIVATGDTVAVVLLVTCLSGECSLENAIKIGSIEFLLKYIVYYFHERIWQSIQINNRSDKARTFQKSISWRIVATTMTFIISGTVLEAYDEIALYIALTEFFTKLALYYIHERVWLKLPLGKVRRYFFKKR